MFAWFVPCKHCLLETNYKLKSLKDVYNVIKKNPPKKIGDFASVYYWTLLKKLSCESLAKKKKNSCEWCTFGVLFSTDILVVLLWQEDGVSGIHPK